jgi:hypothetical protein
VSAQRVGEGAWNTRTEARAHTHISYTHGSSANKTIEPQADFVLDGVTPPTPPDDQLPH